MSLKANTSKNEQKSAVATPTTVMGLTDLLRANGFREERDSPESGALRYDLPESTRYILVSEAWGGLWPTKEEDGVSAGLYDSTTPNDEEEAANASDNGRDLLPVDQQVQRVLEAVQRWGVNLDGVRTSREDEGDQETTPSNLRKVTQEDKQPPLAPLFKRYPGQNNAQPAFVELDGKTGELTARYNPEIGNAVPMGVHNNLQFRFSVPNTLTGAAVADLLERLLPLAERVHEGFEETWNGSNKVGILLPDTNEAFEEIEHICSTDPGDCCSTWIPDEWLDTTPIAELVKTGESLEEAAVRIQWAAWAENTHIDGDIVAYLKDRISLGDKA